MLRCISIYRGSSSKIYKTRVIVNVSKENATYDSSKREELRLKLETEELGKRAEVKPSILAFLYNFYNKNR